MPKQTTNPADYIEPLNMNGLQGRMLHVPSANPKHNKEILVVYGHHALLERWWGLMQNFNAYGNVTMPDLPGFGGMDSFYKIGQKPTIDNLADYLASFIKLRYKRKRIILVGISFGFTVVTRMLQRYPELTKKVDFLISAIGFSRYDDFSFSRSRMLMYRMLSRTASMPVVSSVFRMVALNPWVLTKAYARTHNAKKKFAAAKDKDAFDKMMEMEIVLWHVNDLRTHMYTTNQFLHVDNCKVQIDLPVWHIGSKGDFYFDNHAVEQHMRIIFKEFNGIELDLTTHAPSVVATKKESAAFIPVKLRRVLHKIAKQ
ncbi:MAG TPA: alpha/beta hydrolase [Candidatus Saccharimonadales bacterium]|nr:alpha/beta hydrolase [Candidatus Saccharimonadales bacterium]